MCPKKLKRRMPQRWEDQRQHVDGQVPFGCILGRNSKEEHIKRRESYQKQEKFRCGMALFGCGRWKGSNRACEWTDIQGLFSTAGGLAVIQKEVRTPRHDKQRHDSRRLQWRRDEGSPGRGTAVMEGGRVSWEWWGVLLRLEWSGWGCKSSLERRFADKF